MSCVFYAGQHCAAKMKIYHPKRFQNVLNALLFPKLDNDIAQNWNSQNDISTEKEIQSL